MATKTKPARKKKRVAKAALKTNGGKSKAVNGTKTR
jgi:hypothetical protein